MKMYADYLAERDSATVFYNENGFVTYAIQPGGECYWSEFYVKPEKRGTSAAFNLYMVILAKAAVSGATHILGSVDTTTKGWQLSEKLMKKVGFEQSYRLGTMIYFKKNL